MPDITDQRTRDLECDRLLSAGLCMASAAIAAARHLPRIGALAGLFEPRGAVPVLASIIVLSGILAVSVTFLAAAATPRRAVASACVALGALFAAFTVPFAHQGLALVYAGIAPSKAGAIIAFATFGLVAALAAGDLKPEPGHLRRSAAITVVALVMAAIDADGIFACILMVMGFLFFTLWKQRAAA